MLACLNTDAVALKIACETCLLLYSAVKRDGVENCEASGASEAIGIYTVCPSTKVELGTTTLTEFVPTASDPVIYP